LPGISIHAVDVARGMVAAGMRVEVIAVVAEDDRRLVARGVLSATGTLDDIKDFYSIRINDQWRVIFKWLDGEPHEVQIVDYH
jgi:plasmid maintenance system killer protein